MQEWWAMFSCFLLSDLSLVGNSGGRVELVDWWPWRKQSDWRCEPWHKMAGQVRIRNLSFVGVFSIFSVDFSSFVIFHSRFNSLFLVFFLSRFHCFLFYCFFVISAVFCISQGQFFVRHTSHPSPPVRPWW